MLCYAKARQILHYFYSLRTNVLIAELVKFQLIFHICSINNKFIQGNLIGNCSQLLTLTQMCSHAKNDIDFQEKKHEIKSKRRQTLDTYFCAKSVFPTLCYDSKRIYLLLSDLIANARTCARPDRKYPGTNEILQRSLVTRISDVLLLTINTYLINIRQSFQLDNETNIAVDANNKTQL